MAMVLARELHALLDCAGLVMMVAAMLLLLALQHADQLV